MGIGQHPGDFLAGIWAAVAAGILFESKARLPYTALLAYFALLLAMSLVLAWKGNGRTWAVVLVLCFVTGALCFASEDALPRTDISAYAGEEATVEGVVMEEPHTGEEADGFLRQRYRIEVCKVKKREGEYPATGGMYVYAKRREKEQLQEARIGDRIRVSGRVRLPHGYGNPGQLDTEMLLRSQGITAQMAGGKQGIHVEPVEDKFFLRKMAEIRASYRKGMESVMPRQDAAAIFAMLFGGYAGMRPELVEAFTATGLVHILSVSGSHISLVAATIAWLGSFFRLPKPVQAVLVMGVIVMYCVLAGCVPPVIRSGIMGGLAFLAVALEREKDAKRILLLTGIGMLLASPLLLFHISFQLSFAATAGLLYLAQPLRQWLKDRNLPEFLAGSFAITLSAQVFALPLMAWYFNQVSLSSLLANLVVVPIVEGMIVLGLLAGILAFFLPFLGNILFLFDSLLLGIVYEATRWMARLPGSQLYLPTMGLWTGGGFYAVMFCLIQEERRKETICNWVRLHRSLLLCAVLAGGMFFAGWRLTRPAEVMFSFIDVGQGDSMLMKTVHGHAVMFDTGGTRDGGFDIGARVDVPYLLHYGVTKLDYIFLSHAHEDHAAGAGGILRRMPVGAVITAGEGREEYVKSMRLSPAEAARTRFAEAREGEIFEVDGVRIEVIYAPRPERKGTGNEVSNVYRVSYGSASFLVTGDLVKEEEAKLLKKNPDVRATVLKCGHHGSATSTSDEFLGAVSPQWAVFCVGKDNSFGHPHPETVKKVKDAGIRICRTDEDGAISFYTDGRRIRMEKFRK